MKTRIIYGTISLVSLTIVAMVIFDQSQSRVVPPLYVSDNSSGPVSLNGESDLIEEANGEILGVQDQGRKDLDLDFVTHTILFDGNSYQPNALTIKRGDTVVFVNNSRRNFWPVSNNHPEHSLYNEFNASQEIAPGGQFEFKFVKTGSWQFHDEVTTGIGGLITVLE